MVYQQDILKRLGINPNNRPFIGGAVGNYVNGMGQAYNKGFSSPQGLPPQLAGGLNVANKAMVDAASLLSGTPGYNQIQDKGIQAFTDDVRQNMILRTLAPIMATENITPAGNAQNLNINKSLSPGKETTLDSIPHTLKAGKNVSPDNIDYFLNEYSNRPIVGDVVKGFLSNNPSLEQKTQFIFENF